jgi:exopolyphosphatase/guanosine-5'-triphosphate,3'-diphosphate pyrophosphatase
MRVAAIDVGTNSVHLVVAEISPDGEMSIIEKQRAQVELGSGGLDGRELRPQAQDRAVAALAGFREVCDLLRVESIHCAATSAVREASNGVDFCRRVKAETGIHVRIITGLDEARLIHLGAAPHLDFSKGPVVLVDIGGGSTEIILCDAEHAHVRASVPLGHLRATELFRREDPMAASEVTAIRAWAKKALAPLKSRFHPDDVRQVVGTSGTIRALARMASLERGEHPPEHDHGLVLHRAELESFIKRFRKHPASRLARIPGFDERRRQTLPAGAVVLLEVLRFLDVAQVQTSAYALREGLLIDWVRRHRPELERSRSEADPRRRSVLGMMDRYGTDQAHARHIADLAVRLFDATSHLHRLRVDDRRTLEFAALVHDIGHHISGEDHHKHGEYLVRNTRMRGFTAPEIDELALIVLHHRGRVPKKADLQRLPAEAQARVRVLSALVAIADGSDRGHDRNTQDLGVQVEGRDVRLTLRTQGSGHLERWAVVQRAKALEAALDVHVSVQVQPEVEVVSDEDSARAAGPGVM